MTNSSHPNAARTATRAATTARPGAKRTSILFLCTGNSARSIMAEAIANGMFGRRLEAVSAGMQPKPQPHPLAIRTLEAHGLKTDGLSSKPLTTFAGRPFDLAITLCSSAGDACAGAEAFGAAKLIHWNLPDPPAAAHAEDLFEAVYDALEEAIGLVANGPEVDPAANAVEASRQISRRFSPRAI